MLKHIEEQIKKILENAGVKGAIEFSIPPKPEMGDLAFGCFGVAKEMGKNPAEAAKEIVEKIEAKNHGRATRESSVQIVEKVQAFGPYINFYLSTPGFANMLAKEISHEKNYGAQNIGKGKKVIIEYPSENTHKEFHIGHLRNVCIGNCLVQLYKKCGYKMTPINYINDFGANVVKCLWYIQKTQNSKLKTQKSGESKQRWLGEMYAEASNYIKEHEEEVRGELDEFQKKLEARDSKVSKLFNQTRTWSLEGLYKIHKELGAMHDVTFFEKDMKDKGQKKVDQLLKKGIAQVGERDAIIIDLKEYGLDIALLRKSTGAGLYLTSDLALAEEKFKKYKVDENINITGAEQIFYFKQLFKVLELNGFKNKMTHIGYGLVNLPSGKMSSRTGSVILYEDLRDEIYGRMLNETQSRHADWKETKVKKTAMALTMAILKFDMQKHEAAKNITFDINEAASFEGFSAPYVLYVVARINSLMKKGNEGRGTRDEGKKKAADLNLIREQEEKKILMLIAEYPEAIRKALENYNPSVITKYSFDVAQAFNNFYNKHSILNADSKKLVRARLALCGAVHSVLTDALKLLTIETVSEM